MNKVQKYLTLTLWGLLIVATVSLVASGMLGARRAKRAELPKMFEVPDFALVDQNGGAVSKKSLAGQVWVADFIFTQCAGACPVMTNRMQSLQSALAGSGVRFVSVSVDPEHDTPAVFKAYAAERKLDERNWAFLTGKTEDVFELVYGMKISAKTEGMEILHSERFVLVDGSGWIRAYYNSKDLEEMKKLAEDAKRLAGGGR